MHFYNAMSTEVNASKNKNGNTVLEVVWSTKSQAQLNYEKPPYKTNNVLKLSYFLVYYLFNCIKQRDKLTCEQWQACALFCRCSSMNVRTLLTLHGYSMLNTKNAIIHTSTALLEWNQRWMSSSTTLNSESTTRMHGVGAALTYIN